MLNNQLSFHLILNSGGLFSDIEDDDNGLKQYKYIVSSFLPDLNQC